MVKVGNATVEIVNYSVQTHGSQIGEEINALY
jgi:hypothetical protein